MLLLFGLVREYKGLRHLLAAMPAIRSELADVRLLIAGEFWEDKKIYLQQIAQLGISARVTIVDRYIPNEELPAYFAAADVAVLPYDHVTQSAVVQLAFGFRLPVITTHVGGLAEVVSDGDTGLLVPPGDPAALAGAVTRYFREGCRERMAQAIEQSRPRFDWQDLVMRIEELAK
jgi:D-inositol-3-phosphate glycosyltransferase